MTKFINAMVSGIIAGAITFLLIIGMIKTMFYIDDNYGFIYVILFLSLVGGIFVGFINE